MPSASRQAHTVSSQVALRCGLLSGRHSYPLPHPTPTPSPPTPTGAGFSRRPFKNPRAAALWATFLGNVVSVCSLPATRAASPRARKRGVLLPLGLVWQRNETLSGKSCPSR